MTAAPIDLHSTVHLPDFNAAAVVPGLSGKVDLRRDVWGIPHIRAVATADAFAGLGFAHTQDRLWQMEALLRRGTGRYAEWVGKSAVAGDILARQLDTTGASKRDFALINAETRTMLEAYARGVNAFIALGTWPAEYALLGARPAVWEPWHSMAVMRQIGFLMGSVWWKLWRAAALPIVGAGEIGKLRFDDGGDDLLCLPPGAEGERYLAALADLKPGLEAMLATGNYQAEAEVAGGSNNWVLSSQRTATGRPLLAGDPHRVLEMPSMYYQAHLACDEFDAIGLSVPGAPGFPNFGHNGKVAWCVTHAFVDIHDLYIERFDAAVENTSFKGGWKPVTHRAETISVRGDSDVVIDVVETMHGPVIVGDPKNGTALVLRSMQFAEPDTSFDCTLKVLRSSTVEELYAAGAEWGLMDHNLVAADTNGQIGNRVRAKVPVRPRANGWLPVPGWTGEHEWDGLIPFEEMPCSIDPVEQAIVTANNRVVENGRHYFCTDAMPPHRTRRIWQRLEGLTAATVEDMASIHRDTVSVVAIEFRDRIRTVAVAGKALALRDRILDWDGAMDAESRTAVAYVALRTALTKLVADRSGVRAVSESPYTKVPPGIFGESQIWWTVPQLLRANDTGLLKGATWDELLAQALADAAIECPDEVWATVHRPILRHPLSAIYPEHAAALDKPCGLLGGDNDTPFATGYIARLGMKATYAALSRYVFDVGAWDNCQWIVFHGASGHPASPSYDNQNAAWAEGKMVPMLYDWDRIKASATSHQQLLPS
ncbi:penicillin acylase family protein [Tardiphaga sp.]|uniref:penicillin acylase family protein n=1 Tax=Tardiphaga sp. TaxID=1926292 RepID=UPI0025E2071E|nr:penicillin acylase family protein [Tardiphaga sp.]